MRCGTHKCAVFVASAHNPKVCVCGHAAMYHVDKLATFDPLAHGSTVKGTVYGGTSPFQGDQHDQDDLSMYQQGWKNFQDTRGLERFEEVPQYDNEFSAEDDLDDPMFLADLADAVKETAAELNESVLSMRHQFRSHLQNRRGGY